MRLQDLMSPKVRSRYQSTDGKHSKSQGFAEGAGATYIQVFAMPYLVLHSETVAWDCDEQQSYKVCYGLVSPRSQRHSMLA